MRRLAYPMMIVLLALSASTAMADAIDDLVPVFRLEAGDLGAMYNDLDPITDWTDSGPYALALTTTPLNIDRFPGSQRLPQYVEDQYGGHAVVRFDGSNHQMLNCLGATDLFSEASQTFIVVAQRAMGEQDGMLFGLYRFSDAGNNRKMGVGRIEVGVELIGTPGNLVGCDTSWGGGFSTAGAIPENVSWAMMEIDGLTLNLYIDGVLDGTGTIEAHSAPGVTVGVGGTELIWRDTADFFTGDIYDVMCIDRLLNAGEKTTIAEFMDVTYLGGYLKGDMDGSGAINNNDIHGFILALTNRPQYEIDFPEIDADVVGDIDGDGSCNNNDITPYVVLLVGSGPPVPEPATLSLLALGGLALVRRRRR